MGEVRPTGLSCSRRAMAAQVAACLAAAPFARALAQTDPADSGARTVLPASQDRASRMTVPVALNGQGPFQFVVDTGSSRSVVSDRLALTLGLPAGPTVRVQSTIGQVTAATAHVDSLEVGGRMLRRFAAPVFVEDHIGAAGILGIDALAKQKVLMDFAAGRMIVGPSSRRDEDPGDIVVRARTRYGQLLLADSAVGGVDLFVIVDTGGEDTIGNLELQRTLHRRRPPKILTTATLVSVTGEELMVDVAALPTIVMGGVQVRNAAIAYADLKVFNYFGLGKRPAMLLGMNIIRNFKRVSVDFKAREVRFRLPPA